MSSNVQCYKGYSWNLDEVVGESESSKVTAGWDYHHDRMTAVKILGGWSGNGKEVYENEVKVLKMLQGHPNVIKLYTSFCLQNKVYVITEYITCDMVDYLNDTKRKLASEDVRWFFGQIIDALSFMHSKKIMHADLKLENIMLDVKTKIIKIIDFGHSCLVGKGKLTERRGTPGYMAPEMFTQGSYDPFKADIYSLGVVLFGLVFNKLPFEDINGENYYRTALTMHESQFGRWDLVLPNGRISKLLHSLLLYLLHFFPKKRICLSELKQHPWLVKKNLWNRLWSEQKP